MNWLTAKSGTRGAIEFFFVVALISAPARSADTFCGSSDAWDTSAFPILVEPLLRSGADDDLIVCTFSQIFSLADSPGDRSSICPPPSPMREYRDFESGAFLGYFTAQSIQQCLMKGVGKFDPALIFDPSGPTEVNGKLSLPMRKHIQRLAELRYRAELAAWPDLPRLPRYKIEAGEE